jgi:hypothetical protein
MLKQWNIKGVLEYGQTVILAPVINWPPFILSLEGLISLQSFHWDVGCTGLLCIQWTLLIFVLFSDSGKVVSSDLEGDGWMMWWTKCRFLGTIMHLSSSRQTGILFRRQSNMLLLRNGMICLLKFKRCQVFLCSPALFVADFTSKMTNPL